MFTLHHLFGAKGSCMRAIILGVLLLSSLNLGLAQSETGRAVIGGSVSDPDNNFVSGAGITIRETQTGLERKLQTDSNGQFRAAALPVGTYTVEAVAAGFGVARIGNLTLAVGETKDLNITLRLASVQTEVLVVEVADVIDRSDPSNSININSRAIADLPIRGRNFTEFVQLSPNVTQESNRFGIVVNGQRSINSNISIDGVDFNDPLQGGPRGGGPNESAFFFPQLEHSTPARRVLSEEYGQFSVHLCRPIRSQFWRCQRPNKCRLDKQHHSRSIKSGRERRFDDG